MEQVRDSIGASKTLEYLDLSGCAVSNINIALEGLLKNKSLKTLLLTSCKLQPLSLPHLSAALFQNPNLKVLKLKDNKLLSGHLDVFCEALSQNAYL